MLQLHSFRAGENPLKMNHFRNISVMSILDKNKKKLAIWPLGPVGLMKTGVVQLN